MFTHAVMWVVFTGHFTAAAALSLLGLTQLARDTLSNALKATADAMARPPSPDVCEDHAIHSLTTCSETVSDHRDDDASAAHNHLRHLKYMYGRTAASSISTSAIG